jgi:uncharacterized membrane protein
MIHIISDEVINIMIHIISDDVINDTSSEATTENEDERRLGELGYKQVFLIYVYGYVYMYIYEYIYKCLYMCITIVLLIGGEKDIWTMDKFRSGC